MQCHHRTEDDPIQGFQVLFYKTYYDIARVSSHCKLNGYVLTLDKASRLVFTIFDTRGHSLRRVFLHELFKL
jgi:hypothetical protein